MRRKFAQEGWASCPPAVHVRDNLELKPSAYRITLRGVVVGEGEAFPACSWPSTRRHHHAPDRHPTTDPAFGLPAHWIDDRQRKRHKWRVLPSLIQKP